MVNQIVPNSIRSRTRLFARGQTEIRDAVLRDPRLEVIRCGRNFARVPRVAKERRERGAECVAWVGVAGRGRGLASPEHTPDTS